MLRRQLEILTIDLRLYASLETPFFSLLNSSEKNKAERFRFPTDRSRYILSHGLLRFFLSDYLSIDPAALTFHYGPKGKPFVDGEGIYFNMSHSKDRALYGFSSSPDLGVDIESMRELDEWPLFPFSPRERAEILMCSADLQKEAFYRAWTRKEAYLKALGIGFSGCENRDLPKGWTFETPFFADGYVSSVAYRGTLEKISREHPILKMSAATSIETPPT